MKSKHILSLLVIVLFCISAEIVLAGGEFTINKVFVTDTDCSGVSNTPTTCIAKSQFDAQQYVYYCVEVFNKGTTTGSIDYKGTPANLGNYFSGSVSNVNPNNYGTNCMGNKGLLNLGTYAYKVTISPCVGSVCTMTSSNFEIKGSCVNQCTSGKKCVSSSTYNQCLDLNSDGCYEWNLKSCASGTQCVDNRQGTNICVSNCVDKDGDGYGQGCAKGLDCNDNDPNIHPGAVEGCNGKDDNCEGNIDEGILPITNSCGVNGNGVQTESCSNGQLITSSCTDADVCVKGGTISYYDGLVGTEGVSECKSGVKTCQGSPTNWIITQSEVLPTSEVCDGKDNDCNGKVDEGNVCSSNSYYCDKDGDGSISSTPSGSCSSYNCVPIGCQSMPGTDCNDNNGNINSGKSEVFCDQIDNDCNANTKDDVCGTGNTCDYTAKQCVNTCTAGIKCKDQTTKGTQDQLCIWSNLITTGNNAFCDNTINDFKCNLGFNNCDGSWTNGCEISISNDKNNCGGCGKKCSNNEVCSNGGCIIDNSLKINYQVINAQGFMYVIEKEKENGIEDNQLTSIFENIKTSSDTINTPYDAIILEGNAAIAFTTILNDFLKDAGQYNYVHKTVIIDSAEYGPIAMESIGPATKIDEIANSLNILVTKVPYAKNTFNLIEKVSGPINKYGLGVGVAFSLIHGFNKAGATTNNIEDYIFVGLVYSGADIVDGYKDTFIFADNMIYGIIQMNTPLKDLAAVMGDVTAQAASNQNGCLGLSKWITCGITLSNAFTHPLALVEKVTTTNKNNKVIFNIDIKNYWKYPMLFSTIYTGGTITDEKGNILCNLAWKKIDLSPAGVNNIILESPLLQKNKKYMFSAKMWYNCNVGCEDDSGCYKDGCCDNQVLGSSVYMPFTISNTPPIINDIKLNDLSAINSDLIFYEGDKINVNVLVTDMDKDNVIVTYNSKSYLLMENKNCKSVNDVQKICSYSWQTKQGDKGNDEITFTADDGKDKDIRKINFEVKENKPIPISPKEGEITNTQNPTFKWQGIASLQPVQYLLKFYEEGKNTPLYITKTFADPAPTKPDKSYTLNEYTLPKDKNYFWEVIGINNNGIALSSGKIKFYVDCYLNEQCGLPFKDKGCNGNYLVEVIKTPVCVNPGTIKSACGVNTKIVTQTKCNNGCAQNKCWTTGTNVQYSPTDRIPNYKEIIKSSKDIKLINMKR